MKSYPIVIIGGGVAGTTAAETFRAQDPDTEVLLISDEKHPLYSRVLLPHAVKDKISPDKAFLKKAEFYAEKKIEALFGRTVLRADFRHRVLTLDGGEEIGFGKLVIAVGAKPRAWDVPGAGLPGVLRLQTFEDAKAVHEAVVPGTRLAIVGSGFIALEFAAIALAKGARATLINRGPHFWTSSLGPEIGAAVEAALRGHGIEVRHGAKAAEAFGAGRVEGLRLSDGETLACDAVGVGIGAVPPCEPFGDLKGAHGILADAALATRHEDVWACGDCAEFEDDLLGGLRHAVGNWTNAMAQGRHVGKALLGERAPYRQLTQYTTNVIPGASLIFLGECKNVPGSTREVRVAEEGKKIVEWRLLEGRTIGAILLNAPELRAEAVARVGGA